MRGLPTHVIGVDDAPFAHEHRGDVALVGAVFAGLRLEGVVAGRVRRDGANATPALVQMIGRSRFARHLQAVLLQGIAVAGFNVIDIHALAAALSVKVIVVTRRRPDLAAIRRALLERVPGGRRKWALIERVGPMEPAAGVWLQRAGIGLEEAAALVTARGGAPVQFTFYWPQAGRWEGQDFQVEVDERAAEPALRALAVAS
jgi:endonuclease V-like protein UPF0215 family